MVAARLKKYAVDKESLENSLWESTNSFTESRLEDNCNLFRFRPQLEPNQLKSSHIALLEHMLQFHFPSHTAYRLCPLFHINSFNLFVKFASPHFFQMPWFSLLNSSPWSIQEADLTVDLLDHSLIQVTLLDLLDAWIFLLPAIDSSSNKSCNFFSYPYDL